jgi:hypothetical protein
LARSTPAQEAVAARRLVDVMARVVAGRHVLDAQPEGLSTRLSNFTSELQREHGIGVRPAR